MYIFISGLKGLVGNGFMSVAFLWQGIEWTTIEYFNNAIICDLIEKVGSGWLFSVHSLSSVITSKNLCLLCTAVCGA